MSESETNNDATFAEAFYIGNLLFVGLFYLLLVVHYLRNYKNSTVVGRSHLKQTLILSTITTLIFLMVNIYIMLTTGYNSAIALILLEVYYMLIAPVFLGFGILGFVKASQHQDYCYPIICKKQK